MRTFKVPKTDRRVYRTIELICPECGNEAGVPLYCHPGALIIAAIGLRLVFDPPGHIPPKDMFPETLECRECHSIFGKTERQQATCRNVSQCVAEE